MNPTSTYFNLKRAERYLKFAIQFTPQYGDSFIEMLRLYILLYGYTGSNNSSSNNNKSGASADSRRCDADSECVRRSGEKPGVEVSGVQRDNHPDHTHAELSASASAVDKSPLLNFDLNFDLNLCVSAQRVEQQCANAQPNYGQLWFKCKQIAAKAQAKAQVQANAQAESKARTGAGEMKPVSSPSSPPPCASPAPLLPSGVQSHILPSSTINALLKVAKVVIMEELHTHQSLYHRAILASWYNHTRTHAAHARADVTTDADMTAQSLSPTSSSTSLPHYQRQFRSQTRMWKRGNMNSLHRVYTSINPNHDHAKGDVHTHASATAPPNTGVGAGAHTDADADADARDPTAVHVSGGVCGAPNAAIDASSSPLPLPCTHSQTVQGSTCSEGRDEGGAHAAGAKHGLTSPASSVSSFSPSLGALTMLDRYNILFGTEPIQA